MGRHLLVALVGWLCRNGTVEWLAFGPFRCTHLLDNGYGDSSGRLFSADISTGELRLYLVRYHSVYAWSWTGYVLFAKYLVCDEQRSSRPARRGIRYACHLPELRFACKYRCLFQPHHGWFSIGLADNAF